MSDVLAGRSCGWLSLASVEATESGLLRCRAECFMTSHRLKPHPIASDATVISYHKIVQLVFREVLTETQQSCPNLPLERHASHQVLVVLAREDNVMNQPRNCDQCSGWCVRGTNIMVKYRASVCSPMQQYVGTTYRI